MVSREGIGVCPLPNDWRFTSQGHAVYLLLVGGLLTARWWFAYCSQLVCLLEAKTNPYCQESI